MTERIFRLLIFIALFSSLPIPGMGGPVRLYAGDNNLGDTGAVPPAGEKLYWGHEPVEELSRTRSRRCLNGVWEFIPADNASTPVNGWGYIRVPGAWSTVLKQMPGVVRAGTGRAWEGFSTNNRSASAANVNCAWYRRPITIPEAWRGRRLFVDFDRVCTDAEVFVDGEKAGDIRWPGGVVEITGLVSASEEAMLEVRVVSFLDKTEATEYMGDASNHVFTKQIKLDNRGLTGDVFLISREPGAYIEDVFIQPSTRQKQLKIAFGLEGDDLPAALQVQASCVNSEGVVEKEYSQTLRLVPKAPQELEVVFDWEDPALWDFLQPNLYTLRLRVTGEGVDDEISQVFGFREFWIEGRKFMLNGKEFRLRPRNCIRNYHDREIVSTERMDGAIDSMISLGGNIQEFWPWDHYVRGTTRMLDLWCERADRKGWPVMAPVGSAREFISQWDTAESERSEWLRLTEREIKRLRNHPSILMWIHSPNRLALRYDQNPTILGNRERLTPRQDPDYMNLLHGAEQANEAIRSLDPTRPVTLHHGAAAGDLQTINNYLGWIPLQEQEEWLSRYMASGDIPYLPVEFGWEGHLDTRRGRNGWRGTKDSESLMTEFIASYFGPEAFREEDAKTRLLNPENFKQGQEYKQFYPPLTQLNNEMLYLFAKNVYLSWRTMNAPSAPLYWYLDYFWKKPQRGPKTAPQQVCGPFEPGKRGAYVPELTPFERYYMTEKSMDPTPASAFFKEAFSPVVAWICAPQVSGDIAAFTAKDHHFTAGGHITKAIALLNDTREEQSYGFTWEAFLGEELVASGSGDGQIKASQTLFLPLEFRVPSIDMPRQDGYIELSATIGDQTQTDRFGFRLYRPGPGGQPPLLIFDPLGKSQSMLEKLGYSLKPWKGDPALDTLVIGREAFSSGVELPGSLEDFVRAGGRVIIMQQQPQWLEQAAGFRTGAQVVRRVFPIPGAADMLEGIDREDLRDWSGHSSLLPVVSDELPQSTTSYPPHGWHWSNRGGVTSAPVEKPHIGGWKPLLECDFGSMYSPLMTLRYGRGEVILCQLDLEDHAETDPAAAMLCQRMIAGTTDPVRDVQQGKTCYSGSARWDELLKNMSLVFERMDTGRIPRDCGLLIVGPQSKISLDSALAFASSGGKVLSLPGSPLEGNTRWNATYSGSAEVPGWPECAGLSLSDLHVRALVEMELFIENDGRDIEVASNGLLARENVGKGVILFSRFDPDMYQADEKTYFRIARWRSYRVLSQLLSNLGAKFRVDEKLFAAQEKEAPELESLTLSGEWLAKQTLTLPRDRNPSGKKKDPGVSEAAMTIVSSGQMPDGQTVVLPAYQESFGAEWTNFDGESVFQREVTIPAVWQGQDLLLELGKIDDYDNVYFNGVEVGHTGEEQEAPWSYERSYLIPAKLVSEGGNVLIIRVFDNYHKGGVLGSSGDLQLRPTSDNGGLFDGWYSSDYRRDFPLGDDPHRYYRW